METIKQRAERHIAGLMLERNQWIDHWQELSKYIQPCRGKFLQNTTRQGNKGKKQNSAIIDSSGTFALRTLASGMMSGATPHSRPWFRLATPDPDLMDSADVRAWLETVEQEMRNILSRSNFYNAQHIAYEEMGLFGIGAMFMQEDPETVARFYPLTAGEFFIGHDDRGKASVFAREMDMTVRNIVKRFGLDNVSNAVRAAYDRGNYETEFRVRHYIAPNELRNPDMKDNRNMAFLSVYYEPHGEADQLLSHGGYHRFPVIAPRWRALDDEAYGRSPAMDALGDVKELQLMQKRKNQAIGKMVNPPMVGPTSLRHNPASIVEGSITYVDEVGQQGLRAAHEVQLRPDVIMPAIEDNRKRIERAFYADLFLMLTEMDRKQVTAREIDERHEEKMLALGPVMERLADEGHNPIIDGIFDLMMRGGVVPPPPEELQGMEIKVEYISVLAQAQQAVASIAIERTAQFVGSIAAIYPQVVDKFDADEAAEQYGRMNGVPVKVLRSNEDLKAIRDQRAKEEQEQKAMSVAQGMAEGAKNLASADMEKDNVLSRLARASGQ